MKAKRILSALLALALSLSLCVPAFAYGDTGKPGTYNVISSSDTHSGAVDKNGVLWMWGTNSRGALGNDTKEDASTPIKVMDGVAAVSCGTNFTAVIKTDGSVWTWGINSVGQVGNGTETGNTYVPPAKVLDNVAAVSCGGSFAAAIKTDGSLWMWGLNGSGQLGNGTQDNALTPFKLMDGVAAVSCGDTFAAAVKTDGSLWTWGSNSSGQLGNGTTESSLVPVKVLDGAAAVSCGSVHAAAVKTDGSVWTWGLNAWGELGNGGTGNQTNNSGEPIQTVPVKVLDGAAAVSCGTRFTTALKTDGSLWAWGLSDVGQLGNGGAGNATDNSKTKPRTYQNVPVKVLDGVAVVNCGSSMTVAVKTDGSLWAWGSNTSNRLGNGGAGNSTSPASGSVIQTVPVQLSLGGASIAVPAAPTTPTTPAASAAGTAYPSTQTVDLDGKKVEFQMYALKDANGNLTNYVKVRDLALALNGTKAQFAVDWDGAVNLVAGSGYTATGTENSTPFSGDRAYTEPTSPTKVNGAASDLEAIMLTDDSGGGYTYYKLRDLGSKLGFNVGWSAERGVYIESDKPYTG